ncbi:F-box/RNI-like/FBD-like domains-containing protein [Euphorbia peplus]|nr:F-box/RNI-like/FBD-like domains-containing protein [Euphorbia peplus]
METISIGSDLDRISDLPRNVIDQILGLLPFKDAVRTSALSKDWMEKWHTMPHIILDKEMHKPNWRKLEGMIGYILALHEGRIKKFSALFEVTDSNNVKSWIRRLEQKGIQELFLLACKRNYIEKLQEVPSVLFSCQQLTTLSLSYCVLKLARGFPSLIGLELNEVRIETATFEKLISSCPLLEQLTLKKLHFANPLAINVPKLKYFCFDAKLKSMHLNTPFLEIFSINAERYQTDKRFQYHDYDKEPSSFRFKIRGLPVSIKELYVQSEFKLGLKKICNRFTTYSHLHTLGLDKFCFENAEQVLSLLSLIKSSDNLTTLDITACSCYRKVVSEPITKFWEEQNDVPLMLDKLRKVRVRSFHGNNPEMELIRYVMTNSPALEEMRIQCVKNPTFNEHKLKEVLQVLCKPSTQLSFVAANLESISSKDDYSYNHCNFDSPRYVEDSD